MAIGEKTVLLVGGAGYIGSHILLGLQRTGYDVIVLDNLELGHRDIVEKICSARLIVGDINNRTLLKKVFTENNIDAVIHLAAYAYIGESMDDPVKYYRNNVVGTLNLLESMVESSVNHIIFSSTGATYGIPEVIPIPESHPQKPINPYSMSKYIVERMLSDLGRVYNLKSVCFRYFNAAGADPGGLTGEDHNPETHLIPLVLKTAMGLRDAINIFGRDYNTPDGTCIRDYIHVMDLASAHLKGLEYLFQGGESEVFNLGNERGFSVLEVVETSRQVTGKNIKTIDSPPRPGDSPTLIANSDKARNVLSWSPRYHDLHEMIIHSWQWHKKRHG